MVGLNRAASTVRTLWLAAAVELTREGGQQAARQELSRREYQDGRPSLLARGVSWAARQLGRLLQDAVGRLGSGVTARVLLIALFGLVAVVVLVRLGPLGADRARAGQLFEGGTGRTAAEHRAAAESAASQQRWAEAVRERLRAVVRELEARGVLDSRPGRTADEIAADAGVALPWLAEDLTRATGLFDEIWYGGRPGDRGSYQVVVQLDQQVLHGPLARR